MPATIAAPMGVASVAPAVDVVGVGLSVNDAPVVGIVGRDHRLFVPFPVVVATIDVSYGARLLFDRVGRISTAPPMVGARLGVESLHGPVGGTEYAL